MKRETLWTKSPLAGLGLLRCSGGFRIVSKKWTDQCEDCSLKKKQDGNVPSRRHILGSKIFKEQLMEIFGKNFFLQKKYLVKKSHNAEKPKKRSFRLIQRFLQTENFKKMQGGYPLIKFESFRKKSHSAEKNPKGGPFGLTCTFGSIKKFMV